MEDVAFKPPRPFAEKSGQPRRLPKLVTARVTEPATATIGTSFPTPSPPNPSRATSDAPNLYDHAPSVFPLHKMRHDVVAFVIERAGEDKATVGGSARTASPTAIPTGRAA